MPADIVEMFGQGEASALNGELLGFDVADEDRVVAAFNASGYRCVRDQQGIDRATGDAESRVDGSVMVIFPRVAMARTRPATRFEGAHSEAERTDAVFSCAARPKNGWRTVVRPLLVLCVAIASAVVSTTAEGQCVTFDGPAELFALSDAVLVGTVVANEPTYSPGDHVIVSIATVRMDRSWKGRLAPEVQVGSDRPLEVGRQYVVFAAGKPLSTSLSCRWTEPLNQAKRKLDWLSAKRRSTAK